MSLPVFTICNGIIGKIFSFFSVEFIKSISESRSFPNGTVFSFFDNGRFEPPVNNDIKISVTLSDPQFIEFSTGNVCDGKGPIAGLSRATIQIKAPGWVRTTNLGEGILDAQSKCEYKAAVSAPADFYGGDVKAKVLFSFLETPDYIIAVGDNPPFKNVDLSINLG